MILTKAFQATTSSTTMLEGKPNRSYVAVQNHDVSNPIVFTLGGADAILSPPNGIKVGPGEFGEMKNPDLNGKVTIISGTGSVDCTILYN